MPNMRKIERDREQAELDKKIAEYEVQVESLKVQRDQIRAQLDALESQLDSDPTNKNLYMEYCSCRGKWRSLCWNIDELQSAIDIHSYTCEDILATMCTNKPAEHAREEHTPVFAPTNKFPVNPYNT